MKSYRVLMLNMSLLLGGLVTSQKLGIMKTCPKMLRNILKSFNQSSVYQVSISNKNSIYQVSTSNKNSMYQVSTSNKNSMYQVSTSNKNTMYQVSISNHILV